MSIVCCPFLICRLQQGQKVLALHIIHTISSNVSSQTSEPLCLHTQSLATAQDYQKLRRSTYVYTKTKLTQNISIRNSTIVHVHNRNQLKISVLPNQNQSQDFYLNSSLFKTSLYYRCTKNKPTQNFAISFILKNYTHQNLLLYICTNNKPTQNFSISVIKKKLYPSKLYYITCTPKTSLYHKCTKTNQLKISLSIIKKKNTPNKKPELKITKHKRTQNFSISIQKKITPNKKT
eukprot:TRINITY_DN15762_c0_g1_i8.p1 TRINITY_DN15762_c0_g1~~TRINITY_DN15762_c0_g1_i8.p1  ORF type:complete len:234 (+),score=-20.45 TRINITY_DN15762_c0_g1_i8:361-1062(+)